MADSSAEMAAPCGSCDADLTPAFRRFITSDNLEWQVEYPGTDCGCDRTYNHFRRYTIGHGDHEWSVTHPHLRHGLGRQWVPLIAMVTGAVTSAIVTMLRTLGL